MSVQATILDGPLAPPTQFAVPGAGAVVCFEGIVRPAEGDLPIAGLLYETYDPMAERELTALAGRMLERFGLLAIRVEHSRGWVPNFACSFRLQIASKHRKEALGAMDAFIDALKQSVPIWKRIDGGRAAAGEATP